jgi:hypothetical protein
MTDRRDFIIELGAVDQGWLDVLQRRPFVSTDHSARTGARSKLSPGTTTLWTS